jgi:putative ABC transport system permease protein
MRAIWKKAWADIRRRKLQGLIVASVALLASAVMSLAVSLLTASASPYRTAFESQNGGHVVVDFDSRFATADQVAATAQSHLVTAHGGPWPEAALPFQAGTAKVQLNVLAREDPGGVDSLRLVKGRWLQRPGEIVLAQSMADAQGLKVGDMVLEVGGAEGVPLRVVGLALDVDSGPYPNFLTQPAWVVAGQLDAMAPPGTLGRGYVMVYRLTNAATDADINKAVASITSGLPSGALAGSLSYRFIEQIFSLTNSVILTFLIAFGVIALAASGLVVANVVAGAVLAGYREIGITRALGFSPAQSVVGIMLTILLPALGGVVLGTPLGLLLSEPLLQQSFHALGLPAPGASPLAVLPALLVLLVMAVGSLLPAVRAGRLSPVRAITVGGAPTNGRGSRLVQVLKRARLPRWLSLGAGDAYARPLRGVLTTIAVLVGAATLTFAFGFAVTLERYFNDRGLSVGRGDVVVQRLGNYPDGALLRTLNDQPETRAVVSFRYDQLSVSALSSPVQVQSWRGPSDELGLRVLQGRWFSGPGEVVAGPAFLKQAHLRVGDSFDASLAGRTSRLHIVGSYYTTNVLGVTFSMDLTTLQGLDPTLQPQLYQVILKPGSNVGSYMHRVASSNPSQLEVQDLGQIIEQQFAPIKNSLQSVLVVVVIVLALIAAFGVFNTVLLNTRERVRDTAVMRTLGLSPGRTVAMVVASASLIGIVGGVIGVPAGLLVYQEVVGLIGNLLGNVLSVNIVDVYNPAVLPPLAAASVLVAAVAASLPARWAALTSVVDVMRAE